MDQNIFTSAAGDTESGRARKFPRPRLVEPISESRAPEQREPIKEQDRIARTPAPSAAIPSERSLDEIIARVAPSRVSVLITGETGVGKDVLAHRIHDTSPRAGKPLVCLNCAAVCESLLDSELFGHQRGAFTGADQTKLGLVEAADGGTLFLDEVGELSLTAQTKLLRVIETRQVMRVGGTSPRLVDVRFIAATNRNLDAAIADGRFRTDLLFRLEGIRLNLPPLRERVAEILPAAEQFLREFSEREDLPRAVLTEAAERALCRHEWTGNFRELRNVIERAAVLCDSGRIQEQDLLFTHAEVPTPEYRREFEFGDPRGAEAAGDEDRPERERIVLALHACAGNQTRAARMLGISRRTLLTRLETHNIPRPKLGRLAIVAAPAP